MSILQYFAKKQVGSLPNPEGTLSNARVHTKFHCFSNWHLLEVITCEQGSFTGAGGSIRPSLALACPPLGILIGK